MFVICHYAEVTAKQKDAMTEAEVDYKHQSMYEIMYNCTGGKVGDCTKMNR